MEERTEKNVEESREDRIVRIINGDKNSPEYQQLVEEVADQIRVAFGGKPLSKREDNAS